MAWGMHHAPAAGPSKLIAVDGEFTDDKGKPSTNLSGIACAPEASGQRVCVAIDDQGRAAQTAVLEAGTLRAGRRIALIGKSRPARIVGAEPTGIRCPAISGKFDDLDGEGVAYAAPYFYVIGSHGCSRKAGRYSPSSFIIARFRLNPAGRLVDRDDRIVGDDEDTTAFVETTFRLADALRVADGLKDAYATTLQGDGPDGLNVEGIAIDGAILYAGVRAPAVNHAFVVGVPVADLFAEGPAPLAAAPTVATVALGPGVGIRDLAPLPGGRLLVLGGPTRDDCATHFGLFVALPPFVGQSEARRILELDDVLSSGARCGNENRAKAEAVLPIGDADGMLRVIVLFDGLQNGGAAEYQARQ